MATRQEQLAARARELTERGEHSRALACYREICAAEPYDPDAWMRRADIAGAAGQVPEAVAALYHACELYSRAGMAEAGDVAERILSLDPGHAGARRFLRMRDEARGRRAHLASGGALSASTAVASGVPEPGAHALSDGVPQVIAELSSGGVPLPLDSSEHAVGAATTRVAIGEYRGEDSRPAPVGRAAALQLVGAPRHAAAPEDEPVRRGASRRRAAGGRSDNDDPGRDPEKFALVQAVAAIITTSPLLSQLDIDLIHHMIEVGTVKTRAAGDVVFREGERGSALYLVLSGRVAVERADPESGAPRRLATLEPGAFFGEISMLADTPRSATVRAVADATLLCVSQAAIRALIQRQGRVLTLLMRFFRARLVGTLMATSPLFSAMSAVERRLLVGRLRLRELPPGRRALRQGRPGDGLYVVLTGELAVAARDGDGAARELDRLGPGDVFGVVSMLAGAPASATVRAATRAWLARLPPQALERALAEHPQLRRKLEAIAAARPRP